MVRQALLAAGLLGLAATALPVIRGSAWWIRMFDFPRQQIAVLLAGTTIALCLRRPEGRGRLEAGLVAALMLALAHQVGRIFPYTPLARLQVLPAQRCGPASRLRLMIANVLMDNRRSERLLRMVESEDPDLLLLLETDAWWDRTLAPLERNFPYVVRRPLENTYGLHLFSKLELLSPRPRYLVEEGIPSIEADVRLRSGAVVHFFGVHPTPPRPAQNTGQRDAELLIVGRAVRGVSCPTIVAGDLNDVAWSHTTRLFQRISGLLDPRVGRGMFSTFTAKVPLARWPLDHVFHDAEFRLCRIARLGYFGSDHFPILVELCYDPARAAEQAAPAPRGDDHREAEERIRNGLAESAAESPPGGGSSSATNMRAANARAALSLG